MKGSKGERNTRESGAGKQGLPHLIGNIIGIAVIAVLLPIMAVNITLIVKSYTKPNEVPAVFGVAPLIVMSGSMEPAIKVDDLIFVRKVDYKTLKARDVIAYQPVGKTSVVTHRITEVYEEQGATMFKTKGDFNNAEDVDPVHYNQVVGKYFRRLPGVGKVAMFLQQPVGMVVFVAVPLALFLLYDLLRRYFYNKKNKGVKDAEQEELERLRALAASLEAAPPAAPEAEPVFVPPPDIAAPAYPPIEGEDGLEDLDIQEDDKDEV